MKVIVVGNGMGSVRLLERLVEGGCDHEIVVLCDEPYPGYNRIQLSKLLAGSIDARGIELKPNDWYQKHNIQRLSGSQYRVTGIDRSLKQVSTAGGETLTYDRLVLSTGSVPVSIPVPGADLQGVMFFRRIDDVEIMLEVSRQPKSKAVVIGGGLLGLECASGLVKRGMAVTVVDTGPNPLCRQLDVKAGTLLQTELESRGIEFRCSASLQGYLGEKGQVKQVEIVNKEGEPELLDASLVVVAAGVRPNISLMNEAGLSCDRGVLVSKEMQTSDPDIFAFGECVQLKDHLFGLVAPVYEQAMVVSEQLLENDTIGFVPKPIPTSLKVDGIDLFSSGEINASEHDEELLLDASEFGVYRKIILHNDRIKGVVLYGDVGDAAWYQSLMTGQDNIAAYRQNLLFGKRFLTAA